MKRLIFFGYALLAYTACLAAILYLVGFTGNMGVARTIDSPPGLNPFAAVVVNLLLLGLFAAQHAVMARPWFKKLWTQLVPEPLERSTFVLAASLVWLVIFLRWQPIATPVWTVDNSLARLFFHLSFAGGWVLVLYSSFLIDHFDLFGLRQAYLFLIGRPYTPVPFQVSSLYTSVRHPMMLGFILALWSTPDMTMGRLLFAAFLTGYIYFGIHLEERELLAGFGDSYDVYRRSTSMVFPKIRRE